MKKIEQNGQPSIQQIVFVEEKVLKQGCINKLFKKVPQRCFQTAQFKKCEALMKHQLFSCMVSELERWNIKIQNNEHDVDSRRQLTRNTFLFTGLKRIINIQQSRRSQQLTKLHDWFQKYTEYRPFSTQVRKHKKQNDQEWHIRKTFKHNMQAQINSYRRRLIVSTQNQTSRSAYVNLNKNKNGKNGKNKNIVFTEPAQVQQRFNFDQLKIYHNWVRKNRQFQDISQTQNRFSQQKSRFNQHRYKNFWDGKLRLDDIWQKNLVKQRKTLNEGNSMQEIKRKRIFQVLGQKKLTRFSQNKDEPSLTIRGIDGYSLLKNPFDIPIKKKRRR